MNARCIKYRDTWAAPGSQLFEVLDAGDTVRADSIYMECESEYLRYNKCASHNRFCWICTEALTNRY